MRKDVLTSGGNPSTEVKHYVYDGDQVSLILDTAGNIDHRRLYAPGVDNLLVDEVFNDAGTVGQAERGYWAVTDQVGTIHEILESDADGTNNANHNLVQHLDYDASGLIARAIDASGTELSSLNQLATDVAFAGRDWDNDAGLYYNRARRYDAGTGRFISEDPIGYSAGDANLYRYAAGNPISLRDPSGYFGEDGSSGQFGGSFLLDLLASAALQQLDRSINGNNGSTTTGFFVGLGSEGVVSFEGFSEYASSGSTFSRSYDVNFTSPYPDGTLLAGFPTFDQFGPYSFDSMLPLSGDYGHRDISNARMSSNPWMEKYYGFTDK